MYDDFQRVNANEDQTLKTDDGVFYFSLGRQMFNQGFKSFDNVTIYTFLEGKPTVKKHFDELGGFVNRAIFNEDMLYAAKAVEAGFGIAYAAQAKVYHSHNYTYRQQFRRNFDLGVSQADHPEVFAAYPSESEGIRLVKSTTAHLREKGMYSKIPSVIIQSGFKYMGIFDGKTLSAAAAAAGVGMFF